MQPKNLLYIISDEHRRDALGCYGHPHVQTPNLDRLAANGVRFTNAYSPCPMCVPCRASLHTGKWVHQIGTWSSAEPYEGQAQSWAHRLRDAGHRVDSIGKLHFRDSNPRNGFTQEIEPLHIVNGQGWTHGLLRDELPSYDKSAREFAEQVGAGESSYTDYDRRVSESACNWLQQRAESPDDKPWVAFVSLLSPHYPLIAPAEFYNLYNPEELELPIGFPYDIHAGSIHPALREWYDFYTYNDHFDEARTRQAMAAYYGLCTFLDHAIGRILETLDVSGMADDTRIVYTSDHGESLGDHGQWTKMSMLESSVGVPLIVSGADCKANTTCDTPVNLIDSYQTILDCVGLPLNDEERLLPGTSLYDIAAGAEPDRVTFSEYHDGGTTVGHFMLRKRIEDCEWKYVYYVGHPCQLFNLTEDPDELDNLGESREHLEIRSQCERELRKILDPEAIDALAHADQQRKVEQLGGRQAVLKTMGDFGYTPITGSDQVK